MPNDDTISDYLARLELQRKRVQHLRRQQIIHGTNTPFSVITELEEARADIAKLKAWLRAHQVVVDDLPDDTDSDAADIHEQRATRLRARFSDHTSFINNRIDSFVGRTAELATIRQRIAELLPTGGYVTITGQAGQGKSSIIAALLAQHSRAASLDAFLAPDADLPIEAVTKESVEPIAHHFIPFNPGPDHQISLLRNLIARLALQHNLSEIYVASESRPALKDYFTTAIVEVAASGAQAIIYIDGLDQIEEDPSGVRDLSFLPTNPPSGIVFVLGTRPNDTLKPLELLKPRNEYQLPPLSRHDFDAILRHRQVTVAPHTADRFYAVMAGNALFLDLAAQEIGAAGALPPEQIIARLADDPANLFSFAIERLQRHPYQNQWERITQPVLGLLLAARESLSAAALKNLIGTDSYSLRQALQRLGGLVARDQFGRYYLFHLKLREFLGERPAPSTSSSHYHRAPLFDAEEVASYHQYLANWCESGKDGLDVIWRDSSVESEQERRAYAREHYITNLAAASNWDHLWSVVDNGVYGRAKLRHDPSTRAYVQDLDRARDAVLAAAADLAEPITVTLPRLWRYSLLRGSLASQVDNYPDTIFAVLAALGRDREAVGLAELLVDPKRKTTILCHIGLTLHQHSNPSGTFIIARAVSVANTVENSWMRTEALSTVVQTQAWAGLWQEAVSTVRQIDVGRTRASMLSLIAQAQAQAGLWDRATATARTIDQMDTRATALSALAEAQAQAGLWQAAAILCDEADFISREIDDVQTRAARLSVVAKAQAQTRLWEQAIATVRAIELGYWRATALSDVAKAQAQAGLCEQAAVSARAIDAVEMRAQALIMVARVQAQAGQRETAASLCDEALIAARAIKNHVSRAGVLREVVEALAHVGQYDKAIATARALDDTSALSVVAEALAQAGLWEQATTTARMITQKEIRASALSTIAKALDQAGQLKAAANLCDEVIATARAIDDMSTLSVVAEALAQAGLWEQATTTARMITQKEIRASALSTIAKTLAQAGQLKAAANLCDEAIATVRAINYAKSNLVFSLMAEAQAQAGLWEQATATAGMIDNKEKRASALSAVAKALAHRGLWQQATTIARTIGDRHERASALSTVAKALAHRGLWQQATTIARTIDDKLYRVFAISAVAEAQAQAGHLEDAASLSDEAAAVAGRMFRGDAELFDAAHRVVGQRLSVVAQALARAGWWERAIAITNAIRLVYWHATALSTVAQAQAQAGLREQAIATASMITDAQICAEALRIVAEAQAEQPAPIAGSDNDIKASARAIDDEQARILMLKAITKAQAGEREDAARLCNEATSRARAIADAMARTNALRAVAQAQIQATCHYQAIDTARMIEDVETRINTLRAVAESLALYSPVFRTDEIVRNSWRAVTTDQGLWELLCLANSFIVAEPTLLSALLAGADWVAEFLQSPS